MNWKELRTRGTQEFSKHLDLALYRLRLNPWENPSALRPAANYKFFFGENNADIARRAALLREHLPAEVENILQDADRICQHEFDLLGYKNLNYGPDIDWHRDPVHAKRSPVDPWFKINFLSFHEVGDHKIIWELNRHQHLVTLAKAWRLTGKQNYANELLAEWYSWQKANPYPIGINWASALEATFRALSWLWFRSLLAGCPQLPPGFEADLLRSLQLHGRYIHRYLSTYFSPNTHLLGEAVALFFIGTTCPHFTESNVWQREGWRIILQESVRQVRPDGVYFEQALYYHIYALDFFLHARRLAYESGLNIPHEFDAVLHRMLDVVNSLSASGSIEAFGDDDGGRVFNPRRNQVENLTDPLALGALTYDQNAYPAAQLTEESIWLFGDQAIRLFSRPRPQTSWQSKAFPSGGLYLINDDVPCPQQLMIDAGPQGIGHSGHGHADALSIRFSVNGHRILIDPGTFGYISAHHSRDLFRGTGAHNTLRVDQLDQAVPEGPFAWSSIPKVKPETWLNGRSFDYFVGSHDGYCRLPHSVEHRRSIFHLKGGLWLIRDQASGHGRHLLETFWHFAPNLQVIHRADWFLLHASNSGTLAEPASVALLTDCHSSWKTELTEGVISPAYGSKLPAPVLRASIDADLPQDCAMLLLPAPTETVTSGIFASIHEGEANGVRGYHYQTAGGTELFLFSQSNSSWTCGPWRSDAAFLYCQVRSRRFAHVIMVSGSFAAWGGKQFISHPSVRAGFEWSDGRASQTVASESRDSSQDAALREFSFTESGP
jgi:hypothetical protein